MAFLILKWAAAIGSILFVLGTVTLLLSDSIIKMFVKQKMKLVPTTDAYKNWLTIPIDIYMNFYLYNLTNGEAFEKNGSMPIFEEIGPFVYKEQRTRENITNNQNGTLTFSERRIFSFVPEMSAYSDQCSITTLNLVAMTAIDFARKSNSKLISKALNLALEATEGKSLLVTRTANEILFGYEDDLMKFLAVFGVVPDDSISFFYKKNFTIDGRYTIFTGETNLESIGRIETFNGLRSLDIWSSTFANMINGTDFSLNYPYMNKSSQPYTFQSDVCRSLYVVYNETNKTLNNIEIYGYLLDEFLMANTTVNPYNSGFCVPAGNCLPAGIFDISKCIKVGSFNAPVYFSLPHFLFGYDQLVKNVSGLQPNFDKHKTLIYFEPLTGLPMKGNKRVQLNTRTFSLKDIPLTKNLPNLYFPLYWIDENFEINQKIADQFYYTVKLPLMFLLVFKSVTMSLGSFLILVCIGWLSFTIFRQRRNGHVALENEETPSNATLTPIKEDNDEVDERTPMI